MSKMNFLHDLLHEQRTDVLNEWQTELRATWGSTPEPPELHRHLQTIYDALSNLLTNPPSKTVTIIPTDPLAMILHEMTLHQVRVGVPAGATTQVISSLKRILTQRITPHVIAYPSDLLPQLAWFEQVCDHLLQLLFESFVATRERVITQQSLSLVELSTPVLRLWHQILMLPLVGVVDTARARHFTESLLEAVARYEALVTIIDVTGVPVLDTAVARHLMKTIDAARLLGTKIIMTGISPEGAQTLTKLGISFAEVICRASLRAGIAEALRLVGRRIAQLENL